MPESVAVAQPVADRPAAGRPLVIVVKRFPRLSETFILNEFLELRRQGVTVRLVAIMDPHETQSQPEALAVQPEVTYLQDERLLGCLPRAVRAVRRHPLGALRAAVFTATRRTRAAWRNLVHALVLVSYLDEWDAGHLHAHFAHAPAALALMAHKTTGCSYSVTGHAKDLYTTLPANLRLRAAPAAFVATCTGANRTFLTADIGLPAEQVLLCRHGVDLARFAGLPRSPVPGRILSVGRLVPKKGHDVLIRAVADLVAAGHDLTLRIVGSGDLRQPLAALAAELGIADRVSLPGARPQAELLEELATAELFALAPVVLPNGDRDGVPNVLMEAMAAGVPVLTTAVSGIPEVVRDDENGVLVPSGDVAAFSAALAALHTDPPRAARLAAAARAEALTAFDLRVCVAPLADRFRTLTGQPDPDRAAGPGAVAAGGPAGTGHGGDRSPAAARRHR